MDRMTYRVWQKRQERDATAAPKTR